uniref:Uncharacterized protein n=1 Tax=Utricularia reniformis TaxID=192314 RepID=A0A1Y0B3L0_9LAMI|nr:hypothetical protein AEK19_MT1830 [Utricularia reniformis]ART32001.1 hypothetical protein AEK19_MT1830 [Utricularia reniformis]
MGASLGRLIRIDCCQADTLQASLFKLPGAATIALAGAAVADICSSRKARD